MFAPGLPQTSAAMFPTAGYDTQWQRTPVTYYRPVTQFDPNYGTTVTSLQPCTSYQYQAQRVPLVSPRLISDNIYSANRWPAVTAPGYYPTGLAPAAVGVPTYPTLQQIPSAGVSVQSNMPYYANAATSTGPSNTLPLNTMGTAGPSGVTTAMYAPAMPSNAIPIQSMMAAPSTSWPAPLPNNAVSSFGAAPSAISGATVPAAAYSPATIAAPPAAYASNGTACPNGVCAPGAVPPPNIPGAASVTPIGPPTYQQYTNAAPVLPNAGNNTPVLPNAGDVRPILPSTVPQVDPEANRAPSLGTSAAAPPNDSGNVATMFSLNRLPMVEVDRNPSSTPTSLRGVMPLPSLDAAAGKTPSTSSADLVPPPPMPGPLLSPLQAPRDFDAKPRWNPKLLPPADRDRRAAPQETVA
jgi:hypothetical protein